MNPTLQMLASGTGTEGQQYESDDAVRLNLSQTFVCRRIKHSPQMTFKACEARQRQCNAKDKDGIHNQFAECRGCKGQQPGRNPATDDPDQPGGYHLGDNTVHDKFPCQCCGAKVWITGGYCTSCRSQFVYAAQQGLSRQEAVPILRRHYENGGVRPRRGGKNNNAKTLIDWKGEQEKMGSSKKGTCGCCKRAYMSLPQKVNGLYVCGYCLAETKKGLTFDEIRETLKAKEVLAKVGKKVGNQEEKAVSLPEEKAIGKTAPITKEKSPEKHSDRHVDIRATTKQEIELLQWFRGRADAEFRSLSRQFFYVLDTMRGNANA